MRTNNELWTAAGFGVLAGMRSMTAPAFLTRELSRNPTRALKRALPGLTSRKVSQRLGILALGELVGDKSPSTPARTALPILTGRILSGAITGAAVSRKRKGAKLGFALVGAAAAIASSYVFYGFRRLLTQKLRVPNVAAGLVEDGLALALGSRLTRALR
ncbi:DUF4126 domain-containing protein [Corallococcus exiguus]|uniref:DUF4126 family protein n=1 Tax=Corallococcus TaxID=83461 RepID=UPI000ECF6F13|nr:MULTISPECIES: DUF4126 family protein [Corallococcus]NNB99006.1 DUF4126 domain-containing protein [Corallococcus exiguus]NPC51685.1 DUF4126 domain-containing protein [Corallococcus exiguus]RKH78071.1 DUF4126 domain-containing protein [Corallococcus sp. AB032C]